MAGIFISYRRSGTSTTTYRLVDDLRRAFGAEQIFLDVESIEPGIAFAEAIQKSLHKSSVALIIIGSHWVDTPDPEGKPRLQDPADWVRQEVRAALHSKARVIPVLVEGAVMPEAQQLPEDIRGLTELHAFTLLPSQTHWAFDVNRLIAQISSIDNKLKRLDSAPESAGQRGHYSYKVIAGFVVYVLVALTAMVEGWVDSDEVLGAIFFFLVAAALFWFGLLDSRKGLVSGKKGAITGLVLSVLSIIGHSVNYSAMQHIAGNYHPQAIPTAAVNPVAAGSENQYVNLTGHWVSPQGSLQIQQEGEEVMFVEYNVFGAQVAQGEGFINGNQFNFNYYNQILGLNAAGSATLNGRNLQISLTEPNSGQQFSYIYYRQ